VCEYPDTSSQYADTSSCVRFHGACCIYLSFYLCLHTVPVLASCVCAYTETSWMANFTVSVPISSDIAHECTRYLRTGEGTADIAGDGMVEVERTAAEIERERIKRSREIA
jgi:hypothetical protein